MQSIDKDQREAGLEEAAETVAEIAKRSGATQEEAHALLLLERLGEVFDELSNVTTGEKVQFSIHHQALVNMIAVRVVGTMPALGRGCLPENESALALAEGGVETLEGAVDTPLSEPLVDGLPGWEVPRQ